MKRSEKKRAKEYNVKNCKRIKRPDGLIMYNTKKYTFREYLKTVSARYSSLLMYTVYNAEDRSSYTYRQVYYKAKAISQFFINKGYKKGDKVAIFGESSPEWMIFYFGLTNIGLIAVPILPAFSKSEAINAFKDSGIKALCAGKKQFLSVKEYVTLSNVEFIRLEDLFYIQKDDLFILNDENYYQYPAIDITNVKLEEKKIEKIALEEDDIASIIYTSGTTGNSKGVVLTHKNLLRNADVGPFQYFKVKKKDRVLSILPVSHVYEFTCSQLLCTMRGSEIHFLGKPPVVSLLLPALKAIRPQIILSVPLLMEKIYKAAVAPQIKNGGKFESLYNNPITRPLVCSVIKKKLLQTFGNNIKFFGLGGAPLDSEVEEFLYKCNFPYAIGYGLTETSPLLAGGGPKSHKLGYIGNIMSDVDMILLDKDKDGVGEIAVKGPSVTSGYYNNDKLNEESFTSDGYFKTGDLGYIDKKRRLALKGRCKSVILGPSGENIYPEAIESLINNQQFVEESLVVNNNGSLLALIKIDIELYAKSLKLSLEDAKEEAKKYVSSIRATVNKELSSFNRLDSAELHDEAFERTATQKIKRFLYPKKKN